MHHYAGAMFGPKLSRVFATRTNAMWWSAMVLITAYCVAADSPAEIPKKGAEAAEKADKSKGDPWAGMKDVAKKREELLP